MKRKRHAKLLGRIKSEMLGEQGCNEKYLEALANKLVMNMNLMKREE